MCDCMYCAEPVQSVEPHHTFANGGQAHLVCLLRQVLGSVAHLERRCGCFLPGSTAGDPQGLTRRQAAEAAVALWRQRQGAGPEDWPAADAVAEEDPDDAV